MERYKSGSDLNKQLNASLCDFLKPRWDTDGTYHDIDFLNAALQFRNMPIQAALDSENYIIKILAIMDRRVGKRTLTRIADEAEYKKYPKWIRQFYKLRLSE